MGKSDIVGFGFIRGTHGHGPMYVCQSCHARIELQRSSSAASRRERLTHHRCGYPEFVCDWCGLYVFVDDREFAFRPYCCADHGERHRRFLRAKQRPPTNYLGLTLRSGLSTRI
jgi:hypothetical protein